MASRAANAQPPFFAHISDLISRIRFAPEEGRIWLDNQRMVLLHASALGVLRRELIESVGLDRARGLLTRMGYNSGSNDAELARKLRGSSRATEAAFVGPQLHMLEGVVMVEPVRMDVDEEKGLFRGEFLWHGSAEAEEHIRSYGIGTDAICWQQVGYASGFISRYMGRPVLFRETQCIAQGAAHCRIEGRTVDDWDGDTDDLIPLRADLLTSGLAAAPRRSAVREKMNGTPQSLLGDVDVVGVSAGFNAVCHMVRRVASSHATVLFQGESGVGKEILARSLHAISPRSAGPFVAVNCAAIPDTLIEAELFGVEKGAFTGALANRPGRFERAQAGTLFLDEIGILSPVAQGKLLRALQEREIERVGDTRTRKVDVRVVAATNLDLREEVRHGRFREDLFFRLNVFPITVPPLRERREDIPVFLNHFLRKFNQRDGRTVGGFTHRAIDALFAYDWPGNIRELENLVERGVIMAPDGGAIDSAHLFSGGEQANRLAIDLQPGGSLRRHQEALVPGDGALAKHASQLIRDAAARPGEVSLHQIQTALIEQALEHVGGNQSAAARLLGMTRSQLVYQLKARAIARRRRNA